MEVRLEQLRAKARRLWMLAMTAEPEQAAVAASWTASLLIVGLSGYAYAGFLDGLASWLKTEIIDSLIWPTGLMTLFVWELYMYGMEKKVQYIAKAVVAAIACSAWVGRDGIWQKLANSSLGI